MTHPEGGIFSQSEKTFFLVREIKTAVRGAKSRCLENKKTEAKTESKIEGNLRQKPKGNQRQKPKEKQAGK